MTDLLQKKIFKTPIGEKLIQWADTAEKKARIVGNLKIIELLLLLDVESCNDELLKYYGKGGLEPRPPFAMLRFLLTMLLFNKWITGWCLQVKSDAFLAILTGFSPNDVPGVGTCEELRIKN
jgi:hypothetical protein